MSAAPAYLRLALPTIDEREAVQAMLDTLDGYSPANLLHESYYEGTFTAQNYGFSIPPNMRNLEVVAGWGGTTVDVLEERLDWLGWRSEGDTYGLESVFAQNLLGTESGMAHLDALIYGVSIVSVGAGAEGEPDVLVTPMSPKNATVLWDARTRRVSRAIYVTRRDGMPRIVTLYSPDETVTLELGDGSMVVTSRDRHNLGAVPIVLLRNRVRASDRTGRSEITSAVRYYTDAAVRTMLGMEVHREFYQAPQRWAMNVDPDKFVDASGTRVSPWHSIQGRVWAIPPNDDAEAQPSVGQFSPASPTPYIDMVREFARQLAAEAGMPVSYLGFPGDQAASADAIRALESRLVKRAERRQSMFGQAWMEVGRLALQIRDGSVPDEFLRDVSVRWRDANTPTRAASADEAVKLASAGIIPPTSTVMYDRIGLSPDEQRTVMADRRRDVGRNVLASLPGVSNADAG